MASTLTRFKLVFFVPAASTRQVLDKLFTKYTQELGEIGQYEQCAFITRGTGMSSSSSQCILLLRAWLNRDVMIIR